MWGGRSADSYHPPATPGLYFMVWTSSSCVCAAYWEKLAVKCVCIHSTEGIYLFLLSLAWKIREFFTVLYDTTGVLHRSSWLPILPVFENVSEMQSLGECWQQWGEYRTYIRHSGCILQIRNLPTIDWGTEPLKEKCVYLFWKFKLYLSNWQS